MLLTTPVLELPFQGFKPAPLLSLIICLTPLLSAHSVNLSERERESNSNIVADFLLSILDSK